MIETSAFLVASRYIGVREIAGELDNPLVVAMLRLDSDWPEHDEVPWCSVFVNFMAWQLGLERARSLRARKWLLVGRPITLDEAKPEEDIVIFKRGRYSQPGPDVINAPGHVGFYAGRDDSMVSVIGGNQSDKVSIAPFPVSDVLGVRRLRLEGGA